MREALISPIDKLSCLIDKWPRTLELIVKLMHYRDTLSHLNGCRPPCFLVTATPRLRTASRHEPRE